MNRVEDLEAAILQRAEKLATEYRERAERRRASILKDASEKLRLFEERETVLARAQADLVYLRKVQANELRLHAHMDHVRWEAIQEIEQRLEERMLAFVEQEETYLKIMQGYLTQAAAAIECDDLVIEVNHRDQQRLKARWESFTAAALGKHITLATDAIDTLGGMLIRNQDRNIRLDNTFEGRCARLRFQLHQIILRRLFLTPLSPNTIDRNRI